MLRVDGVRFDYPTAAGGPAFSLQVPHLGLEAGRSMAIIGPSGCGKTTLLKLAAGILEPRSGEVEFEIVASPHAKIGNEGRSEEQREALRREHERLCELDRIARQQRLEAEAERDRIEEERRRRDAARPLHQGQRITNRGRTRQLVSAPGDAFSDVRGPPPPVRRVAPPPAPPRSPAKKGDVAWHLHQALEAALTENEKLKAEIARYKAAYGELPRDGRRTYR